MSMTNKDLARKAAEMCLDILSGNVEERKGREAGNMRYSLVGNVGGSNDQLEVIAYSYECPMYMMCYREDLGKHEILVNTTIYSSTTARHMSLFTSELRKVIAPDVVKVYHLDLGSRASNGVRSRLDDDAIFGVNKLLDETIEKVYNAARKGTQIITVERTIIEALDETVRLQDLVATDIPEADICPARAFVISRANTQQKVLSNLAFKAEPKNIKAVINGIKALEGRPEESLPVPYYLSGKSLQSAWHAFDLQPCD